MKFKNRPKLVCAAALVVALVFAVGQSAEASFLLRLTDLTSGDEQIIIDDSLPGTLSDGGFESTAPDATMSPAGVVSYSGSVGSFLFVMSGGFSDPMLGDTHNKRIDTMSMAISGGEGILQIELTDTDFEFLNQFGGTPTITSSIGGTTDGIVTAQSYVGLANQEFGQDVSPGLQGDFGSELNGSYDDKTFSGFAMTPFQLQPGQQFSMTQVVTVEHFGSGGGNRSTSFDIVTEVHAPEPSAIVMWGIGMACFGLYNSRRRRRE